MGSLEGWSTFVTPATRILAIDPGARYMGAAFLVGADLIRADVENVRRWLNLHFRETPRAPIEVVRVDDPADKRPLLIGTTAPELTTDEIRRAYAHRWPIETHFYVAQGTCAMEMPRAWSETGVERRISLALLAGSLLKAIAAAGAPLPMGPWDIKAVSAAGRLANHLSLHAKNFATLALQGLTPRKYRKINITKEITELQLPLAA